MPTPAEIEAQVNLEREAIRVGRVRLYKNTRKMEERTYASATVYGHASIETLLPHLIQTITATRDRLYERKVGQYLKEINQHLRDLDVETAAAITLKVTFDNVFSTDPRDNVLNAVVLAIGAAIEKECQIRWYESQDPDLLYNIKKRYWHKACGTEQKARVTQIMFNRREIEWDKWSYPNRARIGAFFLDALTSCCNWFDKKTEVTRNKMKLYLVPSIEYMEIKQDLLKSAERFASQTWGMLIPPNDWTNETKGGYLLNELMEGNSLVRRRAFRTVKLSTQALNCLNNLQRIAYRISPFIFKVAEELEERRISVGKFIPIVEIPLPNKPADIEDNYDSRLAYRRAAAEVMNQNALAFKKSCRTRSILETARRFKNVPRYYIPWSFDYRGRMYPIAAFLTPHDTDFGKSLVRFADEGPVNEESRYWLGFQVATTYGLDKATMEERQDWVMGNLPLIQAVATDPLGNIGLWEAAEEPWQFLAACEEYHACVITSTRQTTGLMVATDATCSGLQILAGLAEDAKTAQLVNVLPTPKPSDAYLAVAEEAKKLLEPRLALLLDRKVTKRTVMTIPYNAKPFSNRGYIRQALKDKGVEFTPDDLTQITRAVREAMKTVVPGPLQVMDWINRQVSELLSKGVEEIQWTTPSGFPVVQRLMKPQTVRINMKLLGGVKLSIVEGETSVVDITRHKAATAPNLIHSIDASLLHLAFETFDKPFSVIHDSILTRACDVRYAYSAIRSTYKKVFHDQPNFLREFAELINASEPPPIIGDFDASQVTKSTYFFC